MMDAELVLPLVVCWLEAPDALKAVCVCREWRNALSVAREGGNQLWAQVCRNINPLLDVTQAQDCRRLALGLLKDVPSNQATLPFTPTLGYEDLFAVVDLYRHHDDSTEEYRPEIVASWTCPVTSDGIQISKKMAGLNPYSASYMDDGGDDTVRSDWTTREPAPPCASLPHYFAFCDVLGSFAAFSETSPSAGTLLCVRATLFRTTDMKAVRVLDTPVEDFALLDWEDDYWDSKAYCVRHSNTGQELYLALDRPGSIARQMMMNNGYRVMEVEPSFVLVPTQEDDEPGWLTRCRRNFRRNQGYRPNAADEVELSKITHFDFELSLTLQISLRKASSAFCRRYSRMRIIERPEDRNSKDLLVALDGLQWK